MIPMYKVLKSVISAGGFKLADIQYKVKKLYATGDLTEEQMDELLDMTVHGISPEGERPEFMEMIRGLAERIATLEEKMKEPSEPGEEDPAEYEAWQPWDGISNKYQYGAIVSHKDKLWLSTYKGQNVWEPGAPGTEALWVVYEEKEE
jgi:hypothetical protein